jgi:hypothetical protein
MTERGSPISPSYFRSAPAFRRWLQRNHARAHELLVGFYKVTSGTPSISWTESVDAALCFGWIDGVRKRIDAERYTIRFSPRRSGSIWSAVNVRRVQALQQARRMAPAGERAFRARRDLVGALPQARGDAPPTCAAAHRALGGRRVGATVHPPAGPARLASAVTQASRAKR